MRFAFALLLLLSFAASADPIDWKWGGDWRLRGQAEKNGDSNTRWTEKLRLRVGAKAQIDPELMTEVRMMSATNSRSGNQTLGDSSATGMPRRYIGLDLAYAEWKPLFFAKFYAGRIPQLNYKPGSSTIIMDENVALEGFGGALDYSWNESWRAVLAAGSALIRENYDSYYGVANTDNTLNWAQLRGEFQARGFKFTAGGGFYNFVAIQGKNFTDMANGAGPAGNSEGPPGKYKYPILPHQYFAELSVPLSPATDAGIYAERMINGEAPTNNKSWWLGVSLTHKVWDTQIAYAEVNADVVPSFITNADYAGGVTDSRGWVIAARWRFMKNMNFRVIEYINRTQASILNKEFNKTYLDFSAAF